MTENLKRSRDLPTTADEAALGEAAKRAKLETEQLEADMAADVKGEDNLPRPPAPGDKDGDLPVTIMYKTFVSGSDCRDYYSRLLNQLRLDQDLNEYEHNMVLGLLRKGHPEPVRKIGPGIEAIQIREETFNMKASKVFMLIHTDGTNEDFSVKKCIISLFPKTAPSIQNNRPPSGQNGGNLSGRGAGRGGGPGRGRGGRGRTGPGRGRGRAPMRGGRGGGPRGRGGRSGRF